MRVTLKVELDSKNRVLKHLYIVNYSGDVSRLCGADPAQKAIGQQQGQFFQQMMSQAGTVFGNDSQLYQDLVGAFAPIVAAGPNQKGFSAGEESALKSQAVTQAGVAARNVRQAVGESQAAYGGGNVALPGGAAIGRDLAVENAAASNTANELNQINLSNYETGRENFYKAASGLAGAGNVFNSASEMANAATSAGNAAANTANQIAQENTGWETALMGTLGGLAGNAMHFIPGFNGGGGGAPSAANIQSLPIGTPSGYQAIQNIMPTGGYSGNSSSGSYDPYSETYY